MRGLRHVGSRLAIATAIALLGAALAFGSVASREPAQTGSISGTVKAKGARKLPALQVTKDTEYCGKELPSEAILTAPDGALRNAVVYLEIAGRQPAAEASRSALVLRNERCAFVPHVQAGLVGGKLTLTNEDPLLHNVHLFLKMESGRRTLINLGLPGNVPGVDASRALRRPGIIEVRCDAHDWMSGWILLLEHPYFAVTDERGTFTIANVPPGTYTLKVWHEELGELSREAIVADGKTSTVAFQYGG